MKKNIQIGDIFEIKTKLGLSYAQLTHRHPSHAELIRIFRKKYSKRPDNLEELCADNVEFSVLFTLIRSYNTNLIEKVGNSAIQHELQVFPKFRDGTPHRDTKIVETWWIWDGKNEIKVGPELTEEQKSYPRLGILNLPAVIGLIEGDTHPSLL